MNVKSELVPSITITNAKNATMNIKHQIYSLGIVKQNEVCMIHVLTFKCFNFVTCLPFAAPVTRTLPSCEAYKLTCLAVDIDGQLQKESHGDLQDDVLRRAPDALAPSRSFYFVYKRM